MQIVPHILSLILTATESFSSSLSMTGSSSMFSEYTTLAIEDFLL